MCKHIIIYFKMITHILYLSVHVCAFYAYITRIIQTWVQMSRKLSQGNHFIIQLYATQYR